MQVFGKIGDIRGVPFYLGHNPGKPFHTNVVCNEAGQPYTEMDMLRAHIGLREVAVFLSDKLPTVATLLDRPIDRVGVCSHPGNIPHIVELKDNLQ